MTTCIRSSAYLIPESTYNGKKTYLKYWNIQKVMNKRTRDIVLSMKYKSRSSSAIRISSASDWNEVEEKKIMVDIKLTMSLCHIKLTMSLHHKKFLTSFQQTLQLFCKQYDWKWNS